MITKEQLAEKLAEIIRQAEKQNFHVKQEEVQKFFPADELSEEQMKLVYDYLLAKKIVVEGYLKENASGSGKTASELSEEERKYLEEYKEMLGALEPERQGERSELFQQLREGRRNVRDRLSELLLFDVLEAAEALAGEEALLPDLVQEGNLCLVQALENLSVESGASPDEAERTVMQEIRQGMQALAEQQKDMKSRDRRMVHKVQELKDSVAVLKEEMGRKVYLDEVADFMSISEEEAEAILKLAGEEVPKEE